uniref:pyridoxal 5'-phosphate synthase n=1 Tax=Saccharum hybrid cultivar R570 TaxID=131158 RepID=A0A059Q1W9_9POAL|nr:hypothetical protein SHCRBa_218_D04_R_180 [Saccharum hybrid cultivar R570]
MAGAGAAASALSSPWRALLQRALDANGHATSGTPPSSNSYVSIAFVPSSGLGKTRFAHNCRFVSGHGERRRQAGEPHRRVQEYSDKIQINTDARSNKIGEIKSCPFGEICWYFTDSWEQFRISGSIDVIDASSADPAKLQHREKAWFSSSVKSRLQYLGPQPGILVLDDEHVKDVHLDQLAGPVDAFCLLVLDPEKVDYLNLKSNQRLMFTRQNGDGSNDWMAVKVSP